MSFVRQLYQVGSALQQVCQLYQEINADHTDPVRLFDLSRACERLTLIARELPCYTGQPAANIQVLAQAAQEHNIVVSNTPWFCITLPVLLPRKEHGSSVFLRPPLCHALDTYFRQHDRPTFTDCVLCFVHVYPPDRPERAYRDHDNIELNAVIDTIAMYVLHDDAPMRCAHFYCSQVGKQACTRVFIIPRASFLTWLNDMSF
jgi:hypothetical protein